MMFGKPIESAGDDVVVGAHLSTASPANESIPISVLSLDLPEPGEGWHAFFAAHNITVQADDLGRPAIARSVAKMLFAEQREREAEKARKLAEQEARAIAQDERRRAQIYRGVPVVPGLTGTESLLVAAAADNPHRRISPVEEALGGERDTVTIRPHAAAPADWFPPEEE